MTWTTEKATVEGWYITIRRGPTLFPSLEHWNNQCGWSGDEKGGSSVLVHAYVDLTEGNELAHSRTVNILHNASQRAKSKCIPQKDCDNFIKQYLAEQIVELENKLQKWVNVVRD